MDLDCVKVNRIVKVKDIKDDTYIRLAAKTNTTAKIETDETVIHEYRRISDALDAPGEVRVVTGGGFGACVARALDIVREKGAACAKTVGFFLLNNARKAAFSGACGVAVIAVTVSVMAATCTYAYEIKVEGDVIGTVPSIEAYTQVVDEVETEVEEIAGDKLALPQKVDIDRKLIAKGTLTEKKELEENLKAVCDNMVQACAVKVDGKTVLALPNAQMAQSVLDGYKSEFMIEGVQSLEFTRPVELSEEYVPVSILKSADTAMETLKSQVETQHSYTAKEGDTPQSAADALGVTLEQLTAAYADIDQMVLAGQTLKVNVTEPLLQVKTLELAQYKEPVPYETNQVEQPDKYEDVLEVVTPGEEGLKFVKAYVTKVNGMETDKQVLEEQMLKAPVTQVENVGTKPLPSPIGTGVFSQPYNGTLTSRFGGRWGRQHSGIDIGGSVGDPVYAADNGTVIYSQYNDGGYGYLVQIDHGNGYVTYYGHNSELLVEVGDVVGKGDVIAKLGNTGRSTGPHLHFEVRIDGTAVDPLPYLNQ